MVKNRLVARYRLVPLPTVGLGDFVEGAALHTLLSEHQAGLSIHSTPLSHSWVILITGPH